MGRHGDCDCICNHDPVCEHPWLDIGSIGSLNNLFQISESLDWQDDEDFSPPLTLTLTWYGVGVTYTTGFSTKIWWPLLGVPFDFCTLTYDPDTQTYSGPCNASPTDDLSLSNSVEITICRYDEALPHFQPKWMMKGSIIAADGTTLQPIGQLYPGRKPNSTSVTDGTSWCDTCMVTSSDWNNGNNDTFKDAKKLLFHRFLWMLPEAYDVEFTGIGCISDSHEVLQEWSGSLFVGWNKTSGGILLQARVASDVITTPPPTRFSQMSVYLRPNSGTTGQAYWSEFDEGVIDVWGDNELPFHTSNGTPDPATVCTLPATASWNFNRWDA